MIHPLNKGSLHVDYLEFTSALHAHIIRHYAYFVIKKYSCVQNFCTAAKMLLLYIERRTVSDQLAVCTVAIVQFRINLASV